MNMNKLTTAGWKERVALPEWGITRMAAKLDTGANVSAIHVDTVEELPDGRVRFDVALNRDASRSRVIEADVVRIARIKPSHGVVQERHIVRTIAVIGDRSMEVEFSLVCRKRMLRRILLGRLALAGEFLVDPSRAYLLGEPEKQMRQITTQKKDES